MWKVWITYPHCLWITLNDEQKAKKTELSTSIVDNSVEKCVEVGLNSGITTVASSLSYL